MTNTTTTTTSTTKTSKKKRVQFHSSSSPFNTIQEFEVDEDISIEDLWFTAAEYNDMKRTSRSESREWRKLYSHLLKDTYNTSATTATTTMGEPTSMVDEYLLAFCKMRGDLYRRGLERQCNRTHSEERSDLKDRSRFIVLNLQSKLFRMTTTQQKHAPSSKTTSSSTMEEQIAQAYIEACRGAKTFAIQIARADQLVAMGKKKKKKKKQYGENDEEDDGSSCSSSDEDDDGPDNLLMRKMARRASGISIQSGSTYDSRVVAAMRVTRKEPIVRKEPTKQRNSNRSLLSFSSWRSSHPATTSSSSSPTSTLHHHDAYAAIA